MNIAFQLEAHINSDGVPEIVRVECEPTTGEASNEVDVQETRVGSWELQFVLPTDFDDTYPLFNKFEPYGLSAQTVCDACSEAWRSASEGALNAKVWGGYSVLVASEWPPDVPVICKPADLCRVAQQLRDKG